MRVSDAITAQLYPYEVDMLLIEKACIDNEMTAAEEYFADMKQGVAKATITVLRHLIVLQSESNGGYSLSYDIEALKERIYNLAKDNGLTDIAEEYDRRSHIIDRTSIW
ncbi:MAG: hypothetical protein J6B41_07285 [Alistipes sp.]|nr:hypothetical protein [Alistipes sp.]